MSIWLSDIGTKKTLHGFLFTVNLPSVGPNAQAISYVLYVAVMTNWHALAIPIPAGPLRLADAVTLKNDESGIPNVAHVLGHHYASDCVEFFESLRHESLLKNAHALLGL
jgi:hypothetical protein